MNRIFPLQTIVLSAFLILIGMGMSGCPDTEPTSLEEEETAESEEEFQLNAADVLFWDITVPGADVPLVAQCVTDADCAIEEALPCRKLICHPTLLACVTINTDEGVPCELDSVCVLESACNGGVCVATSEEAYVQCDDGNPCTNDSCDSATGCVFLPIAGAICEDGNPCTENDFCEDGTCVSGVDICPAQCGNGTCQISKGETCGTCPLDCGPCSTGCTVSEFAGCDGCGCEACVCETNPDCCEKAWGPECTFLCESGCGVSTDGCVESPIAGCCGCPCESCVCEMQPACCSESWTSECVSLCASACEGTCETFCGDGVCDSATEQCGNCADDCGECDLGCEVTGVPGCNGCPCEECVCALAPSCCSDGWTALCATACENECGGNCAPVEPLGGEGR